MKIKNFHIKKLKKKELFAYETGLHLGDGCLYINKNHGIFRVEFSGDVENDKEFYSNIVPDIIERLYRKRPRVYLKKGERTLIAVLNSKEVVQKKVNIGIPVGNKLKLKHVPIWIQGSLIPHFIRGLADADFSVSFKKNRKGLHCEPRIEMFTNNEVLADFVQTQLKLLGFKPALEKTSRRGFKEFRIRMYGKKMLNDWMYKIGFFNPKHLSKIYLFEKTGNCPPKLTTEQRLSLL